VNRFAICVILGLFALLSLPAAAIQAAWIENGVPICTAEGFQHDHRIISDGFGGTIIVWRDLRGGTRAIYAQRLNALGQTMWATNGIAVCPAGPYPEFPNLISDGAGGAIIAWRQDYDIRAQKINASGVLQWTAGGVKINWDWEEYFVDNFPAMAPDGMGGAIIAWESYRYFDGGYAAHIWGQRIDSSGDLLWGSNDIGVPICEADYSRYDPEMIADGDGGAIVVWADHRDGWDESVVQVYAQRVDGSGTTLWTTDGVPIDSGTDNRASNLHPYLATDGSFGAIFIWNHNDEPRAQRVSANGVVQWAVNGIGLGTASGHFPTIVSDNAGGAIIAWEDTHAGGYPDIYAQRLTASGTALWTAGGIPICTAAGTQARPKLTTDGSGGAIIAWGDNRAGNNDIYAQRVNASGAALWTVDGAAVCTAANNQEAPVIASQGAGGGVIAWGDRRSSPNTDIYAGFVNASGGVGDLGPMITSVLDVPNDQGGWVRVSIDRSPLDNAIVADYPIAVYNVWQRIDDPVLLEALGRGVESEIPAASVLNGPQALRKEIDTGFIGALPIVAWKDRFFLRSGERLAAADMPPGTWELLGSFAACQHEGYVYRASTLADSTTAGIPYSVYMVSAHTTTPSVWFVSEPDSGYSVDNLPPAPPEGLMAEQSFAPEGLALAWDANAENDLSHYAVYRGLSASFAPAPENRIAAPAKPECFDGDWRWSAGYYYKISAVDVNGNESGFALLAPDDVTGAETPKTPPASYLAQNYPNPFNPSTRIAFGVVEAGHVSLRIYDTAGRLVRVLVDEERPAARYEEAWDGRDTAGRQIASGIYFCRLKAGVFEETRKMMLVR